VTALAPVNPVPVIETESPTPPEVGLKSVTTGGGGGGVVTSKLVPLQPVLTGVVTQIASVCAPAGTVVDIAVSELTVSVA
jgi:hypothetical protein